MPQMSPLPWIFILMFTVIFIFMISCYIFYFSQKMNLNLDQNSSFVFKLKW